MDGILKFSVVDFKEVKLCDLSKGFFDTRTLPCFCNGFSGFRNFCSVLKEYIESIEGDQTNERNVSDILNKGHFPKGFSLLISVKIFLILECLSFVDMAVE
jgi:hypothetical protein